MINETPRVRFAPSPTGYLHVGGLRTALYNYLFAKRNNGTFVLRIEDTDRNRFVEGAVENLIKALKWAGLDFDEGPETGGDFGPYMQSQRLDIYKKYADELIEKGKAYYCFCTPERLKALKEEQEKQKLPQAKYDKLCLHLTKKEVENKLASGIPKVVRLNVEENHTIKFDDIIREHVEFESNNVDDQVLIKSDGYPTYHLANVVDDHLMKISQPPDCSAHDSARRRSQSPARRRIRSNRARPVDTRTDRCDRLQPAPPSPPGETRQSPDRLAACDARPRRWRSATESPQRNARRGDEDPRTR